MKPYSSRNYLPLVGTLLLVLSSIMLGSTIGALAYLLSKLVYFLFVFPLAVGIITLFIYYKLQQLLKVRHALVTGFIGIIIGFLIILVYYGIPYERFRFNFVNNTMNEYPIPRAEAEKRFNSLLLEKSGSSGFFGYMKLFVEQGTEYTEYYVVNQMLVNEFNFKLNSTLLWLYILLELIVYSGACAWAGYTLGKRPFNISARDWYDQIPIQIATVSVNNKENILNAFKYERLMDLCELMSTEDDLIHPRIEVYEQQSTKKHNDVLFTLKQTSRVDPKTVKRIILAQYEISRTDYSFIQQKLSFATLAKDNIIT